MSSAVLFLFAVFLAKAYRRVVEPNEVHIVQSKRGTRTYGKQQEEGDKGAWPGNSYYVMAALVARYRRAANYPPVISVRSEADKLRGVRSILAKHEIEDSMMERSAFGKIFTDEVADQLVAWGVTNVKNIELMDISDGRDSKTVSNIMAKKETVIDRGSRVVVAENIKLAKTAEIEAKQVVDVRAQQAGELVGLRTAQKDQAVGIADERALQDAGIKVIVNSGDAQGGMDSLLDLLTTKGGTHIAGMLEALRQTEVSDAVLQKAGVKSSGA